MSKQTRNDKGRWLDEGKESGTIRLDKDVVDLGREVIQTRVHQEMKVLVSCPECMDPWYLETDNQKPIHKEDLYCKPCYLFVYGTKED